MTKRYVNFTNKYINISWVSIDMRYKMFVPGSSYSRAWDKIFSVSDLSYEDPFVRRMNAASHALLTFQMLTSDSIKLTLPMLKTEYFGLFRQYRACSGIVLTLYDRQHVGLLHCDFDFLLLNKIQDMRKMCIYLL